MTNNTQESDSHEWCGTALANLRGAIDVNRRFPSNVFVGRWSDFYFFDSDWMRVPDTVEHVKTLLDIDGGRCACLWKLDSDDPDEPRLFYVRAQTSVRDYGALLAGKLPGYGWLDAMERLACASDSGGWCVYCEPNNEIAVIGFRHARASARFGSALGRFHAVPIDQAIKEPLSYGFSQIAASPEWHDAFLREYAPRSV